MWNFYTVLLQIHSGNCLQKIGLLELSLIKLLQNEQGCNFFCLTLCTDGSCYLFLVQRVFAKWCFPSMSQAFTCPSSYKETNTRAWNLSSKAWSLKSLSNSYRPVSGQRHPLNSLSVYLTRPVFGCCQWLHHATAPCQLRLVGFR